MNISIVKKVFNENKFSFSFINKSETYKFEDFLKKDLPFFWDSINKDNRSFYLFGKEYFEENMFVVVLFKTKNHYNIAYSDDIHKTNVDIESITFDQMDNKLNEIFDLEKRCSAIHLNKRTEALALLKSFMGL